MKTSSRRNARLSFFSLTSSDQSEASGATELSKYLPSSLLLLLALSEETHAHIHILSREVVDATTFTYQSIVGYQLTAKVRIPARYLFVWVHGVAAAADYC